MPVGQSKGNGNRVRLSDVAAHVGVSRTTVASVLLKSAGENARVGEKTAAKVRAAAEELGYCPNAAAQRLAGKEGRIIGVVIDSYAPVTRYRQLAALERAADELGYRIMVAQSHGELDKIRAYAEDFIANGINGVICLSHDYPDIGEQVAEIFLRLPHVVFLGQPLLPPAHAGWVKLDHRQATKDLTEYLVKQGRRNQVLCLSDLSYTSNQARRDGFVDGILAAGLSASPEQVVAWDDPVFEWDKGGNVDVIRDALRGVLDKMPVDGILANNDHMALLLIRILADLGKEVPKDIAVTGYDNMPLTEVTRPSLTTVDLRDNAMAQEGFELLMDLMAGKQVSPTKRYRTINGKVVPRESA